VAVEGVGTLELSAPERDGMHRIDVRELNPSLQALSRLPMLSAFRYQRTAAAVPALALEVKRFADAGVLAAVADRAVATTLVTSEGRALTEVALQIQNRAQPFLKVTLPLGATMVSVDVAGETAKPVLGSDGIRVPLLRPGFRPTGTYQVSFVYLHAGTPFARKGEMQMTLPKMDIPVGIVQWELFAPERYRVRAIGGNAIDVESLSDVEGVRLAAFAVAPAGASTDITQPVLRHVAPPEPTLPPDPAGGEIRGVVRDSAGGLLPGVTIEMRSPSWGRGVRSAVTDSHGEFAFVGVPAGRVTLSAKLEGFTTVRRELTFDGQGRRESIEMRVASISETVTVSGESPDGRYHVDRVDREPQTVPPSQNVINLQRRTSGVLPIRVDVPRAGTSHQFVKPLVIDQETTVTLRYKRR
jgi:hypothetical protein